MLRSRYRLRQIGEQDVTEKLYEAAFPYAEDVLALPVEDLDQTAEWYGAAFGLVEVERRDDPVPTVILERDGVQIGFAVNGGDASQEGAAILVNDIHKARDEIEANGVETGNWRVEEARWKAIPGFLRSRSRRALLLLPPAD